MGEVKERTARGRNSAAVALDLTLIEAVELVAGMSRKEICGGGKRARSVVVREALVLVGREGGATNAALAKETGLESSAVSRRYDVGAAEDVGL